MSRSLLLLFVVNFCFDDLVTCYHQFQQEHVPALGHHLQLESCEMASKRRNMFYQNKKQETTEIGGDGYTLPEGRATHQRYRTFKTSAEQQYIDTAVIIMESKKVPNGKTFNMRDPEIRQKTIDIIDFLFSIQDVDAMVEVASILKQGLTAEQYNYVLGIVLVHREDARGYLPPWPEVLPSYFLRREVIQKLNASSTPVTIDSEISESTGDGLDYFREDVGLNTFNYNWILHWPSWMDKTAYNATNWYRTGEQFYYYHQQILARYNLERVSRDKLPIINQTWAGIKLDGYAPGLSDSKGNEFTNRPPNVALTNISGWEIVENIYNKLLKSSKSGIILGKGEEEIILKDLGDIQSTTALGDIIFNTTSSYNPDYYNNFFDSAISLFSSSSSGIGTGIGNPLTSLRDPAYYVVLDWITTLVQEFKKHNLPPYTKEELSFDGIKIDEFTVNDTETYFDYFVIDASKGLEPWKKGYKVRQKRLNHTPIQVRLNVTNSNDEDKGALIRIFIGPFHHHSGITFDMSRQMFYELDRFPNTLKVGENIITRNEDDFTSLVDDDLNDRSSHLSKLSGCGLPRRLAVPQGKKEGLVLLMYAMISPFPEFPESLTWTTDAEVQRLCEQNMFLDNRAMGFPFDRLVTNHKHWSSDNHETTNITIYHRD